MELGAFIGSLFILFGLKVPVIAVSFRIFYLMNKKKKNWIGIQETDQLSFKMVNLSVLFFILSEIFCGIETYILMETNLYSRIFHSLTSAFGNGFLFVAVFMIINNRLLKFGETKCLMTKICRGCPYINGDSCKFKEIGVFLYLMLILFALPPLFLPTEHIPFDSSNVALPFPELNAWYDNTAVPMMKQMNPAYKTLSEAVFLPAALQKFENTYMVFAIILLYVVSLILYMDRRLKMKKNAITLTFFGLGIMGYYYMENILHFFIGDLGLAGIGHEMTELLLLLILMRFIPLVFPPKTKI